MMVSAMDETFRDETNIYEEQGARAKIYVKQFMLGV